MVSASAMHMKVAVKAVYCYMYKLGFEVASWK